jgi:hypothetical protein
MGPFVSAPRTRAGLGFVAIRILLESFHPLLVRRFAWICAPRKKKRLLALGIDWDSTMGASGGNFRRFSRYSGYDVLHWHSQDKRARNGMSGSLLLLNGLHSESHKISIIIMNWFLVTRIPMHVHARLSEHTPFELTPAECLSHMILGRAHDSRQGCGRTYPADWRERARARV